MERLKGNYWQQLLYSIYILISKHSRKRHFDRFSGGQLKNQKLGVQLWLKRSKVRMLMCFSNALPSQTHIFFHCAIIYIIKPINTIFSKDKSQTVKCTLWHLWLSNYISASPAAGLESAFACQVEYISRIGHGVYSYTSKTTGGMGS